MSADQGDKDRATSAETAIKTALTAGTPSLNAAVLTPTQYGQAGTLAQDLNRATAVGIAEALRTFPCRLPVLTLATLPAPAANTGAMVYCADGGGGAPVVAFSDGVHWLRVDTLTAVS